MFFPDTDYDYNVRVKLPLWIFLDDERFPADNADFDKWTICRSKFQLAEVVGYSGVPIRRMSFDHDLADTCSSTTGLACAHWLISLDLEDPGTVLDRDFEFYVHSQNPVGAENIRALLKNYLEYREREIFTLPDQDSNPLQS